MRAHTTLPVPGLEYPKTGVVDFYGCPDKHGLIAIYFVTRDFLPTMSNRSTV